MSEWFVYRRVARNELRFKSLDQGFATFEWAQAWGTEIGVQNAGKHAPHLLPIVTVRYYMDYANDHSSMVSDVLDLEAYGIDAHTVVGLVVERLEALVGDGLIDVLRGKRGVAPVYRVAGPLAGIGDEFRGSIQLPVEVQDE